MNSKKYIDRLVKEWQKHNRIIIACDFDDTIFKWSMDSNYEYIINVLKKAKLLGAYISIFTASDYTKRESKIREYCESIGIEIDSINKNPIDLPYGNHGKIYANIFIDDRAGLEESIHILESAINIILNKKLIEEYDNYLELLGEELSELSSIAIIRGWKSNRVESGKAFRDKISELKKIRNYD